MSFFYPLREMGLAFLDLLFPRCCLNCTQRLPEDLHLLCTSCLQTLIATNPEEHCRHCFRLLDDSICTKCLKYPSPFFRAQAPFITGDCTQALANKLISDSGTFLKDSLAAFITMQITETQFPLPELLVPFPSKGSFKLTQALSSQLNIPYLNCLELQMTSKINLKQNMVQLLTEKQVTLISLGIEGLQNIEQAGFELAAAYPRSISALHFQIPTY